MRHQVFEDEHYYICYEGRELHHIRTESREQDDYTHGMKINERWKELKEKSNRNIQSERGIVKRQPRSIQTEGHFGDMKENENFRRFHYRSSEKVYKEFMLYAIGRIINKYHRFLYHEIEKYKEKRNKRQPREGSTSRNRDKGFLHPKINKSQKRDNPVEVQVFEKV